MSNYSWALLTCIKYLYVRCNTRAFENNPRDIFEMCRGMPEDTSVFVNLVMSYTVVWRSDNSPTPSNNIWDLALALPELWWVLTIRAIRMVEVRWIPCSNHKSIINCPLFLLWSEWNFCGGPTRAKSWSLRTLTIRSAFWSCSRNAKGHFEGLQVNIGCLCWTWGLWGYQQPRFPMDG